MRPVGTDKAPNFSAFVQSSFSVIAMTTMAFDVTGTSGPRIENRETSGSSKAWMELRITVPRSALDHRACSKRSCARPRAWSRPEMAC